MFRLMLEEPYKSPSGGTIVELCPARPPSRAVVQKDLIEAPKGFEKFFVNTFAYVIVAGIFVLTFAAIVFLVRVLL
jgi:hypothetical protein